jgi:putative Holliday junction resolvase
MAAPLRTIRLGVSHEPWRTISEVVAAWSPTAFVVGLAYHPDGSENPITPATERFCKELERRYRIPVHRVDETLSTAESRRRFFADNRSGRTRFRDRKDELAAQVILQTWLDQWDE